MQLYRRATASSGLYGSQKHVTPVATVCGNCAEPSAGPQPAFCRTGTCVAYVASIFCHVQGEPCAGPKPCDACSCETGPLLDLQTCSANGERIWVSVQAEPFAGPENTYGERISGKCPSGRFCRTETQPSAAPVHDACSCKPGPVQDPKTRSTYGERISGKCQSGHFCRIETHPLQHRCMMHAAACRALCRTRKQVTQMANASGRKCPGGALFRT